MGKFIDLTGVRFGRLIVLERGVNNNHNNITWKCKCDCGIEKYIEGQSLRGGKTNSCGCLHREVLGRLETPNMIDITGNKYGRLTVIKITDKRKNNNIMWRCKCDCKNQTIIDVRGSDLKSGKTKSCGCIREEIAIGDLVGQKFGRLYVLRECDKIKGRISYTCRCDCDGKEVNVVGKNLASGSTKSCGCLKKENSIKLGARIFNTYDLTGTYGIGYTKKSEEFYFDLEDYDKIKDYYWSMNTKGYIKTYTRLLPITWRMMHRKITGCKDSAVEIDHIDGRKNNNQKLNLRLVDTQKNQMNAGIRQDNTSGTKGVTYHHKSSTYRSYIQYKKKFISFGYFKNKEDAIWHREMAELILFGEYSRRYEELKEKYKDENLSLFSSKHNLPAN
jgi:hypothetical protein